MNKSESIYMLRMRESERDRLTHSSVRPLRGRTALAEAAHQGSSISGAWRHSHSVRLLAHQAVRLPLPATHVPCLAGRRAGPRLSMRHDTYPLFEERRCHLVARVVGAIEGGVAAAIHGCASTEREELTGIESA
jgi:hypothetical protein